MAAVPCPKPFGLDDRAGDYVNFERRRAVFDIKPVEWVAEVLGMEVVVTVVVAAP